MAVRLAAIVGLKTYVISPGLDFTGYGAEMGQIAASIARGDGFAFPAHGPYPTTIPLPPRNAPEPTAWMPPLYPGILALFFFFFGPYSTGAAAGVLVFQSLVAIATCYFTYSVARIMFDEDTGLLAALIFAFYPPAIYVSARLIWGTALSTCFLLGIVLSCVRCSQRPTRANGAGLGILMGVQLLNNPVVASIYPFLYPWLAFALRGRPRAFFKVAVPSLVALVLVLAPWVARNYVVFGHFVPVKSNFGNELALGNNELATGSWWAADWYRILPAEQLHELQQLDEVSRNRWLLKRGLHYIATHPGRFARLTLKRIQTFWTYVQIGDTPSERDNIIAASYYPIALLALLGSIFLIREPPRTCLPLLFLLLFPVAYYVTNASLLRYRLPLEPILLIVAAGFVMSLLRRTHRPAAPA
ncbi:MAG: hypothetical protein D6815_06775 [Candidatus Dadabacteria bacterium]|nr:MAG: hypothetical protein D6815_06775 [Candidatus Dadabacteria bacterium]